MTIGKKIIAGYILLLAILALVTLGAIYAVNHIQRGYNEFFDVRLKLAEIANEIKLVQMKQTADYRGVLLYQDRRDKLMDELRAGEMRFQALAKQLRDLDPDGQQRAFLDEISALQVRLVAERRKISDMVKVGRGEQALSLTEEQVLPLSVALTDKLDVFREAQARQLGDERNRLKAQVGEVMLGLLLAALGGVAAGLLFSYSLGKAITRQLREVIRNLATASAEIVATMSQVASSATQTSTAVAQTTVTAEEVKQTVHLSSQKARQVSDTAQKTAQVSSAGREAMESMIAGMTRIREQTESAAQSIVRLDEQSHAIGEIIATVNDLAEQSNVLSVNAAIEAAKAGDQGKGFTVVAQEIKSLAEQSKQATAQVRALLGDIQKATGSAVMAMDASGKAVEAGTQQSNHAEGSIRVLGDSVAEAAQAAMQIAASSQQQLVGMDQVAQAMESISQASAQNMAAARQAQAAAQDMHELGLRLKQMVDPD
jgi:methyl-accepting chemotaxis protein